MILYSIGCPQCEVLRKKLDESNISYTVETSEEVMKELGITAVPVLEVDGKLLSFGEAIRWIKERHKHEN